MDVRMPYTERPPPTPIAQMSEGIYKIYWDRRFNKSGISITLYIWEKDCIVYRVSDPIVKWAIGEQWDRVCSWLINNTATVQEIEWI